jgi:hypothetical protein
MVPDLQPRVPGNLTPFARGLLEALQGRPEAAAFVLGGGVALSHYAEYRTTHDVDAWWAAAPDEAAWQTARTAMQRLAAEAGAEVLERGWGETRSCELKRGTRKLFSFQASIRTIGLDAPRPSAWAPLRLETFRDNLAGKMNALVGRGAPRDFVDVAEVCGRGLVTPADCWELWQLKNPGRPRLEAVADVLRHLNGIELRRPLDRLPATERDRAAAVRRFIREQLCPPAA